MPSEAGCETGADAGRGRTKVTAAPPELFAFLSSLYLCKPTREALIAWRAWLEHPALRDARQLRCALSGVDVDSARQLEDLLWEYTRLFIGPYRLPCPPLESVYTSPKRLMMQEAYEAVGDLYRRAGLELSDGGVMCDHIGAELNFFAILKDRIASGSGDASLHQELAAQFAAEHLKPWVPLFAEDLAGAAETPLYQALAHTTKMAIGAL